MMFRLWNCDRPTTTNARLVPFESSSQVEWTGGPFGPRTARPAKQHPDGSVICHRSGLCTRSRMSTRPQSCDLRKCSRPFLWKQTKTARSMVVRECNTGYGQFNYTRRNNIQLQGHIFLAFCAYYEHVRKFTWEKLHPFENVYTSKIELL